MKYFVYAFNYLTLFKTIIYAEKEWGVDNTFIMYTPYIADPPIGLRASKINSYIVKTPKWGKWENYFTRLLNCKKIVLEMIRYIKEKEPKREEQITVVFFRDNMITESFLIKLVKKSYSNVIFVMMEEGLGLYAEKKAIPPGIKMSLKKCLNRLFGISSTPLLGLPQGCNPQVDTVICSRPEILRGKLQDRGDNLIHEINLFTKENCNHYLTDIMDLNLTDKEYDFVFLTQPLFTCNNDLGIKYKFFLKNIFEVMLRYGKVLIKPHPRDTWNYDEYVAEDINVADPKTGKCPFECLMGYYGNPQTITLFSSAGCNIETGKPNIFLYDMFPEIVCSDIFDEEFIKNNNIVRCSSMEEFENTLIKKDIGGKNWPIQG